MTTANFEIKLTFGLFKVIFRIKRVFQSEIEGRVWGSNAHVVGK